MTTGPSADPFAELGKIVLGDDPLPLILERVVGIANRALDGDTEASLTVITHDGDNPTTVAFTSDWALALDERQYDAERGPCLDSASAGQRILVADIPSDDRWPQYVEAAAEHGVCSSLSVPLPVLRELTGALNFYARSPGVFDDRTIELAETFAGHAAVAVANAHLYETKAALAEQMRQAMTTRAVIEQAKGIVMRDRTCSADEAVQVLVRMSQQSHAKLRDVAQRFVDQVTA